MMLLLLAQEVIHACLSKLIGVLSTFSRLFAKWDASTSWKLNMIALWISILPFLLKCCDMNETLPFDHASSVIDENTITSIFLKSNVKSWVVI